MSTARASIAATPSPQPPQQPQPQPQPQQQQQHPVAYSSPSYFPQQQYQQQQRPQPQPQSQQPQPQPQQQQQQEFRTAPVDPDAPPNAAANSQHYTNHIIAPVATRPTRFTEEWDISQRGSSIILDGPAVSGSGIGASGGSSGAVANNNLNNNNTTNNTMSQSRPASYVGLPGTGGGIASSASATTGGSIGGGDVASAATALSRSNTLKKRASLRRSVSLRRSGSRRSMKAGSVRSLALQPAADHDEELMHSAFYCPVPTNGNPTEVLANRFQAWRKILKDLIAYFREVQSHYEQRAKSLSKLSTVLNNIGTPPGFLSEGGIDDALQILRNFNKQAVTEATKAKEIEEDVILALIGLRNDLHAKIKEIKGLAGDFKNSVEKEMDSTRKAVNQLQEVLGQAELDPSLTTGKQDPYLLRLAVDRQLERQIDEENYLHQAYLNLENSGRELESIVVGEIQKAYNAYAGILKREADNAYNAVEELRMGPISMPKDKEWNDLIRRDDRFVDPEVPMRSAEFIHYPGRDHYACQEIRAGLLERKSKYLKSYTPGWYVLSPTHLHEFKSADKTQAPVMSLYLPEQKLGSHSEEGSSSNKFILKGRQTGHMHRGHTWVFRAESHDTMMAWYEDIKALTERTPEERNNLMRNGGGTSSRSVSRSSQRSATSSDGGVVDDDDDDQEPPFSSGAVIGQQQGQQSQQQQPRQQRPAAAGRFPSDIQINLQRAMQAPPISSPLSAHSGYDEVFGGHEYATANERLGDVQQTQHLHGQQQQRDGGYVPAQVVTDGHDVSSPWARAVPAAVPMTPSPMPHGNVYHQQLTSSPPHGGGSIGDVYSPPISHLQVKAHNTGTSNLSQMTNGGGGGGGGSSSSGGGGILGQDPSSSRAAAYDSGGQVQQRAGIVAVADDPNNVVPAIGSSPPVQSGPLNRTNSIPLHIPGEYPK